MTITIAPALLAGIAIGMLYFGGLWLTVRHLPDARHPAWLAMISFLVRTAAALGLFYLFTGDSWERLVACLVGFLIARTVLTRRLRPKTALTADAA